MEVFRGVILFFYEKKWIVFYIIYVIDKRSEKNEPIF